jgi:heptosyltransferase-1
MKVLIVKTSSLGDIVHCLPAVTDAVRQFPDIKFDWVAEPGFAEIPAWHPRVERVIPVAWRRWRKNLLTAWRQQELQNFYRELRTDQYDLVIDAQGLLKSALIARMAKGLHAGLDFRSAWEPIGALFYQRRCAVKPEQHAVTRMRQLFAQALDYTCPTDTPDYGIRNHFAAAASSTSKTILFIHGTTRADKEWPEQHWIELAKRCTAAGFRVLLPWGNVEEKARAERIAASGEYIDVLPKTSLQELANLLLTVTAAVAVDTGIGHLAAALDVPTLSLYGPTDPAEIGTCGKSQLHLRRGNVLAELSVDAVWETLQPLLNL